MHSIACEFVGHVCRKGFGLHDVKCYGGGLLGVFKVSGL